MDEKVRTPKIYAAIYWIVRHAHVFFIILLFLFIGIVVQLSMVMDESVTTSFLESLYVLMGDSPSLVTSGNLTTLFHKLIFAQLILLRFFGWIALPLFLGLIFTTVENVMKEKQRTAFEDQLNIMEAFEQADDMLYTELIALGLPAEKADELIKQDRERTRQPFDSD